MSSEKNKSNGASTHSPFWPIFIVFAVLAMLQLLDFKNGIDRRRQIKTARVEISSYLPKAATIEQTVEKVGHDLLALSDGNTNEAAKIVSEFQIRANNPPPPAAK